MKDFDIAKYLRENYEGPFKTFQPLVNLPALKEESEEQLDSTVPYEGPDPHLDGLGSSFDQVAPVEESDIQEVHTASKVFDLSDPESSEDALEWIYDNTDFEAETEDEDDELRYAQIEDIIGYVNQKLSGHEIDYNMNDDDTIELTIKPTGVAMKEDAYGPDTEQGQFDRMMGLINTSLEPQLPMLKKAVDKARQIGFNDKQIFGMLQTSPITGQSVKDLVDDGFDGQEIVDFFATDFSQNEEVTVSSSGVEMEEDTDNVTAADNAAYGADQEIGEPI
jgi:hypothetical protein